MTIFEALRKRGFPSVDAEPYGRIEVWRSWYKGDVDDFHRYRIFNGAAYIQTRRYTVGMAKKVCEDWASLLLNEKVAITIGSGDDDAAGERREQAFVDDVLQRANFRVKANELVELTAALGTGAIIARVVDAEVDEQGRASGGEIRLDYTTADRIIPLAWENGVILDCAFATDKTVGKDRYTYVQIHHRVEDGTYDIDNVLYRNRNGSLREVEIATVPGFETVPAVVHTASTMPQFVTIRMNIANNAEIGSPMGIAVFANGIDQLKGVDIAYDSYVNEFILGKKRVFVMPEFLKTLDGQDVFDPADTQFYLLPGEDGGQMIKELDMKLRTAEHDAGIQTMLNVLSANCGLGGHYYQFDHGAVSTATQVISENSDTFRVVKKHEVLLRSAIEQLIRTILHMGNAYLNAGLDEDVEIKIDFDDSIIEDKDKEFARDLQLMAAGVISATEMRMRWLNEDEATARARLPGMVDLAGE